MINYTSKCYYSEIDAIPKVYLTCTLTLSKKDILEGLLHETVKLDSFICKVPERALIDILVKGVFDVPMELQFEIIG